MKIAPRMPYGSANWATLAECEAHGMVNASPGAFIFGQYVENDRSSRHPISYAGPLNVVIFGASGSGKSMRCIASTLLNSDAQTSYFVGDTKGEQYAITGEWRRAVGKTYKIAPFSGESCGCNPLLNLKPADPSFNARAALLASAMITIEGTQPYFPRTAQDLTSVGLMCEAIDADEAGRPPSLGRVRDMITSPENLRKVLEKAALSRHRGMQNKAGPMLQETRSIRDVIGEASQQTSWLDDPEIMDDLCKPGPDFSKMRDEPMAIFGILPPDKLERHSKWLRLITTAAMSAVMTPRKKGQLQTKFIIDEYYIVAKGGLEVIERSWPVCRGYGIALNVVLQDINQLQELYPRLWQTFLSNTGVVANFGAPGDLVTADWMSKRAGDTTRFSQSISDNAGMSWSVDQDGNFKPSNNQGGGTNYGQVKVPFLSTHEFLNTPAGHVYVWKQGLANTILTDAPLYVNSPLNLKRRARPNPYFID